MTHRKAHNKAKMESFEFPDECADLSKASDILFFKWVDKINHRNSADQRLLIITEREFYLFRSKFFSKTLQLSKRFKWLDIKKIKGKTIDDITITFNTSKNSNKAGNSSDSSESEDGNSILSDDQILHISTKGQKIFPRIYNYIVAFSLESEMPEIVKPRGFKKSSHSKPSMIEHMKMRMREQGNHFLSKSAQNSIDHFLSKNPSEMKLNELKMIMEYLPFFLEALVWYPNITKIIVPFSASYGSHNPINLLIGFLPKNPFINEIVFKKRIPFNFPGLVNSIIKEKKIIQTLTFESCDLNIEQINALSDWIKTSTIEYLVLESALSPIVSHNFVLSFKENEGNDHLKKLVINRAPGIDVSLLISFLPNIQELSLQSCDFEIAEFFYAINNGPSECQLHTINISGNRCDRRIPPKLRFPPYLVNIDVSNIIWESQSLKNFFSSLMHHTPKSKTPGISHSHQNSENSTSNNLNNTLNNTPNNMMNSTFNNISTSNMNIDNEDFGNEVLINLNVSNAKLKPEDWTDFFRHAQVMKGRCLGSLEWNMNSLHKVFFLFLERCPLLRSLSIDGCFSPDDPLLDLCSEFLSMNEKIVRFSCAGTARKWLGSQGTTKLIQCLQTNRAIKSFCIHNNRSGPNMFAGLSRLMLQNRIVENLEISGNGVKDLKTYREFYEAMAARGRPLIVKWPEEEVKDMLQYGTATKEEVAFVKNLYNAVLTGSGQQILPPDRFIPDISNANENVVPQQNVNKPIKEENAIVMPTATDIL
ncbi:hypothetical protein TRFO_12062 [Tritrichomonas foetus]|uniref:Leucine Rich Repeat family protein n=1 Tax=Tritrichomonas foetus TaxID=1144522 RepID=A0A1J4J785_9EUKA|nr:hypothetical protein TRFO_12062 [Tritrichomonas foetus]|eukprot:OHS93052.1 hypothetical protein TRFO_12062 [Tritrichomonas foetus]